MMSGRNQFKRIKPVIKLLSTVFSWFPGGLNKKLLFLFRSKKGKVGILLRYVLLANLAEAIGDNVSIREDVIILSPERLRLGSNISIHPYSYIQAGGGLQIGDNVSIATHSVIITETHTWKNEAVPIKYNPVLSTPVVIEDDVWVAAGVEIIGPCIIHKRSVLAAGAVVRGEVPSGCVVGGVPAKVIKEMNSNQ